MEFHFPFLSPAWLGTALVSSLVASTLLPLRLRRAWLLVAAGVAAASAAALCGALPWFGQLHASAYAACMVAAFIAGYFAILPRARLIGLPEATVLNFFMFALVGGIVGARLGEVWEQWPAFAQGPGGMPLGIGQLLVKIADIDSGGMVWYGGALCASGLMALYGWRSRLDLLELADLFLPATAVGLGIGRVGCFLNGCCYGRPTTLPWAVAGAGGPHTHPTQLYETIACLLLAGAATLFWYRRRSQGQVSMLVLLGYAIWRTFNEALRGDTVMSSFWGLFPATTSQVLSITIALVAVVAAVVVVWRRRRSPERQRRAYAVPGRCPAPAARPDAP